MGSRPYPKVHEGRLSSPPPFPLPFPAIPRCLPRPPPSPPIPGTDLDHPSVSPNIEEGRASRPTVKDPAVASRDPVTNRIGTLQGDMGSPGRGKKGKEKLQVTREDRIRRVKLVRPPDVPQVRPRLGLLR